MNTTSIQDKKKILIIDDNIQIHQDFKKVLLITTENEKDLDKLEEALLGESSNQQDETYMIDCASQGEEGLKMVEESIKRNEPYAVAFVDVRMPPGLDGIETISKIWEIYPDIQIVICTAYSDYSWQDLYDKFGNTDNLLILKKPFDNIEVRQLAYTLSKKWELNKIANLKMNEMERIVEKRTKELQERNEELDNFAHTVAHDLKNPLGVIIGFAQILNEEYSEFSEKEIRNYIKHIAHDSNKMNNIINELILFASLRKTEINIDILNMSDIVTKAINSLSQMIEKNNAEIILPDTFPAVLGYASWVEEVLVNYISNAIKFGGKHPRIKLTADTGKTDKVPEGMVRFCVHDNGPGISHKNQARLFKKFERLDQVKIEGHGLGLSIVRRLIKKLGGQVGVESEIGKGSIFYFTLPAKENL
jgi:signal transduction histidine kinase